MDPLRDRVDFWAGQGFGLGVAVQEADGIATSELGLASRGAFAWPGIFGTWWQVDPAEELILVFMVPGGEARPVRWAFQAAAYEAIDSARRPVAGAFEPDRPSSDGSDSPRGSIR